MTFDPHSLKRLQELGRQLPKELPQSNVQRKKSLSKEFNKKHPIETQQDPQALFHELIKASPDGKIPSHLIARLKELERSQLIARDNNLQKKPSINQKTRLSPRSKSQINQQNEMSNLYASFEDLLLEEED